MPRSAAMILRGLRVTLAAGSICAGIAALAALAAAPPEARAEVAPVGGTFNGPPSYRVTSPVDLAEKLASGFRGQLIIPGGAEWNMVRPCGPDPEACRACGADEFGQCPLTHLPVRSGVSLVGERDPRGRRPVLVTSYARESYPLFQISANDVRVEGIHFRGPSRSTSLQQEKVGAIQVIQDPVAGLGRRVVIADDEFENWTDFGVNVCGNYGAGPGCGTLQPREPDARLPHTRREDAGLVRVERNYIHHNAREG